VTIAWKKTNSRDAAGGQFFNNSADGQEGVVMDMATMTRECASLVPPGGRKNLRELRMRRKLSTRRVAELSRIVAFDQGNEEFAISHARLTQIENDESIPSVYKLFTLSAIYGVAFNELLTLYVELSALGKLHHSMNAAQTHPLPFDDPRSAETTVPFPMRINTAIPAEQTNLLSRVVEAWAEVPFAFLERLNLPRHRYGWIGLSDYMMYPLFRPGTFVQIDECQKLAQPCHYRNEFDRPIYFVELRTGHLACWCDVVKDRLICFPHPLSPCRPREFAYPSEAEIIGRITGLAVRLVDSPRLQSPARNASKKVTPVREHAGSAAEASENSTQ